MQETREIAAPTDRPKPCFLITIDVEGDNLWSRPKTPATRNAEFLPRFQALCESHGLRPTYLANHEMARSERFVAFGREVLKRGAGEIGMHLHAWNTPPIAPLTDDDDRFQPYAFEYPPDVLREKVRVMTDTLGRAFGERPVSHRAGRWGLDEIYARILREAGYRVDCSVTPHVSWRDTPGDPAGAGGSDFRGLPDLPYFLDLDDIRRPGDSPLLEVPLTIVRRPRWLGDLAARLPDRSFARRVLNRLFRPIRWFRPGWTRLDRLLDILDRAAAEGRPCVEFMLHSSELMPGGSPTFPREADIENLYADLEALFSAAAGRFRGATLKEFHDIFLRSGGGRAGP